MRNPNDPDDFDAAEPTADEHDDFPVGDEDDSQDDVADGISRSGTPRLIVVDARAVIHGSESLFELWQQAPADAVLSLVNLLSWAMAHQGAEFVLVVEDFARVGDHEIEAAHLSQHTPAAGQTVSGAVMAVAEEAMGQGRRVTVVSSDVDVIRFASEEKIQAGLADLFAASLVGGAAAGEADKFEKPKGLSAKECAEWDAFVVKWKGRAKSEGNPV